MNIHAIPRGHRPLTHQQERAIVGFLHTRSGYYNTPSTRRVRVHRTRITAYCPSWGTFYQLNTYDISEFSGRATQTPWNPDDPRIEWHDQ